MALPNCGKTDRGENWCPNSHCLLGCNRTRPVQCVLGCSASPFWFVPKTSSLENQKPIHIFVCISTGEKIEDKPAKTTTTKTQKIRFQDSALVNFTSKKRLQWCPWDLHGVSALKQKPALQIWKLVNHYFHTILVQPPKRSEWLQCVLVKAPTNIVHENCFYRDST